VLGEECDPVVGAESHFEAARVFSLMDGDRELFGLGFVDGALAVFEHDCFFGVPGEEEWFDARAFLFGDVERELPRLRAQVQDGDGEWFARAAKGTERVCRAGSFLWLEDFERATVRVGIATTTATARDDGSWCAGREARRARACGVPVPVRAVDLDAVRSCRWWTYRYEYTLPPMWLMVKLCVVTNGSVTWRRLGSALKY
jgi:hypothetical protein